MNADELAQVWFDWDSREEVIRRMVSERLAEEPPPQIDDSIVATYFLALRTKTLEEAGREFSYHATSGIKKPPAGSLLEQCTGKTAGVVPLDATGRLGLLHMAFPLKMLLNARGALTSCDLLHTAAGAIVFDVYENLDARLVALQIPERVVRTFPGPAYGPYLLRQQAGFAPEEPAFGTILKPTAGITPDQVGALVEEAARCPLFLFVKEDEDLYPNLDYSPVKERTTRALAAIARARDARGGKGLWFAPHITGSPHEILETVDAVLEAGATALMLSETYSTGTVRMVREATRQRERPPAIYGHNAGIGTRERCIWREVIDLLARLDGIDFRQTAPVRPGAPFIRPYGAAWEASERVLTAPLPGGLNPTMIARAGGLDQGNIIMNLQDAERRGWTAEILLLAGSAINSIRTPQGATDPRYGAQAMLQALEVHRSGALADTPIAAQTRALMEVAVSQNMTALQDALRQRYPEEFV
jgi:ribulose-bisphosphate carboxylase large chain